MYRRARIRTSPATAATSTGACATMSAASGSPRRWRASALPTREAYSSTCRAARATSGSGRSRATCTCNTSTATARASSTTTCAGRGSCASDWRSCRENLLAVFEPRRPPGGGQRPGNAQHAQHAQRPFLAAFAAAVVTGHEHRLVEAHGAVETARRLVGGAQLEMNAGDAGAARRLEQPLEHALADAGAPVRRTHGEEHEMRALVAELHDGEAVDRGARCRGAGFCVARHHRER